MERIVAETIRHQRVKASLCCSSCTLFALAAALMLSLSDSAASAAVTAESYVLERIADPLSGEYFHSLGAQAIGDSGTIAMWEQISAHSGEGSLRRSDGQYVTPNGLP